MLWRNGASESPGHRKGRSCMLTLQAVPPGLGCVLTTPRARGLNWAPKNQTNSSNSKTIYKHNRGNVCADYTAVSKGMKWGMLGKPSTGVIKLDYRDFACGPVVKTPWSQCRGLGSIPGQGTRAHMPQLKILPAATETQHSQTKFLLNLIMCFFVLRLKTLSVNTELVLPMPFS